MQDASQGKLRSGPPPLPLHVATVPALPLTPIQECGGPLSYYRPSKLPARAQWAILARFASSGEWHRARAALTRGRIDAMMGDGEDISPEESNSLTDGIAMLVLESDLPRPTLILDAIRGGLDWCPRCGSTSLTVLPLPWWWMLWSILFLGVAPFSPPRFECRSCGSRWE